MYPTFTLYIHIYILFYVTQASEAVPSGTQYAAPAFVGVNSMYCSKFKGGR